MAARAPQLLLTCEHGGNRVPARYAQLFRGERAPLASHRGWDPGALELARELRRALKAPLFAATVSRLVADLNRSPTHPKVLSEPMRALPAEERARVLARHHAPHRAAVEAHVARQVAAGARVVHVGVHSFTPVLEGVRRELDVGLLFDPRRPLERALCLRWRAALRAADPALRVRFNQPYRGTSDGLTTTLRARYPAGAYLGIELELNQALPLGPSPRWRAVRRLLAGTLAEALPGAALVTGRAGAARAGNRPPGRGRGRRSGRSSSRSG